MAEEANLVSRRPRRSTAGNRMELALAELALEESQEVEEDVDFVVENEAEDIFESDFASTDEEATQEDVDEGDRAAREEERRERKTSRARVEKATAMAHARQRVTFNPGAASSQPRSQVTKKPKRRVSLGVVVNAETGEVIEGDAGTVGVKRQSQRRHTVMNTSATVNRIKDAEEKRAAIPKKAKMVTRLPTQDELIARALDTEEGNITEHRNYLRLEEEKRAKARVIKQAIEGPVLRWISKKETIQVEVQLPPPMMVTSSNLYASGYGFMYTPSTGGTVGNQAYSMPFYAYTPLTAARNAAPKPQEVGASAPVTSIASSSGNLAVASGSALTATASPAVQSSPPLPSTSSSNIQEPATPATGTVSSVPSAPPRQQQSQLQATTQPQTPAQNQTQSSSIFFSYPSTSTVPLIANRTEVVCKNYVIHELSQSVPCKPSWNDTMSAMFGDHVRWDEVKVFTGKGRPLSRPVRTCPITGLPAKYCDPRTNVPFANVGAYEVLTKVIGRGYVWCSALGCYMGVNESSERDRHLGREAEVSCSMGTVASPVEEVSGAQESEGVEDEVQTEELEERVVKRRRVEVTNK